MFKNKKLLKVGMTLMALIVTMAMSVTATYAWFVISASPKVEAFQLDVLAGGEMLMISFDQTNNWASPTNSGNFKTKLTNEDWAKLGEDLDLIDADGNPTDVWSDFRLGASTTKNGSYIVNEAGEFILPNVTAVADNSGVGGYLEFNIRFRGTAELSVELDDTITKVVTPSSLNGLKPVYAWEALTTTDYGQATAIDSGKAIYTSAAYAARYSFINSEEQAYIDANILKDAYLADLAAYQTEMAVLRDIANNGADDLFVEWLNEDDGLGTTDLYTIDDLKNPAALAAFETAAQTGTAVGTVDFSGKTLTNTSAELATDYGAAISALEALTNTKTWVPSAITGLVDQRTSLTDYYVFTNAATKNFSNAFRNQMFGTSTAVAANWIKTDTAFGQEVIELRAPTSVAELGWSSTGTHQYYYGSLTVRIWLEGWDANCFNQILSDTFETTLGFVGTI